MLFTRCISDIFTSSLSISLSSCNRRFKMHLCLAFFIAILGISGCSVSPESSSNNSKNSDDLKSISQRIIDWVSTTETDTENTSKNKASKNKDKDTELSQATTPSNLPISTKNTYLEQEAQLMQGVSTQVITTYKQAITLMEQKNWQAALDLFDQVIAQEANLSGSYVNKALIFKYLSEQAPDIEKQELLLNKSERLINTAIEINSKNPYAQHFKGQFLQAKGEFEQAEKSYLAALLIWPNYAQAQLSIAVLLELYRGKLIAADHYYRAYLLNHPQDQQVKRWQAALAIKIKRAGLLLPAQQGE